MNEKFAKIKAFIDENASIAVELEKLLTSIPALAPENGGDGEMEKCRALEKWLLLHGIKDFKHYDSPDDRVSCGKRPNLVATIPGKSNDYSIWVCAHLDVVPVGDELLWKTKPFEATEKDGKLFGRGVEDNQQGLVSGVLAALAFVMQNEVPLHTIKLLFMADEEVGSNYGMNFLLREYGDIFGKNDRILIPDGGDEIGETIEIAEKNIAWFKFHTIGKQCHGSRPDLGANAFLASSELALKIHDLEKIFDKKDSLFTPEYSTFQPTMKFKNVDSVNMIPGDDVFCADCRILPCYTLDEVREKVKECVSEIEKKHGVCIEVSELQAAQSRATDENAVVVKELAKALKDVHGIDARCIGIGGSTVAAGLRNSGFDAVVWSSMDETAHQANEYAVISNILKDASTIAYICMI